MSDYIARGHQPITMNVDAHGVCEYAGWAYGVFPVDGFTFREYKGGRFVHLFVGWAAST